MPLTQHTWHKIADSEIEIPFQSNNMAVIEIEGRKISIARLGEKVFAFANVCPHASGVLTDGWLDPRGNVVCPVHGYRFNIQNGRNTTGEGYHMKHWPVEKREDGIFVRLEHTRGPA